MGNLIAVPDVGGIPSGNVHPDRAHECLSGETTMRITEEQRTEITRAISKQDPHAIVYLFGSRSNDNARGGDLDLLVLSETIRISERLDILAELHRKLGEQKIDLVVYPDLTSPFARMAAREGKLL